MSILIGCCTAKVKMKVFTVFEFVMGEFILEMDHGSLEHIC